MNLSKKIVSCHSTAFTPVRPIKRSHAQEWPTTGIKGRYKRRGGNGSDINCKEFIFKVICHLNKQKHKDFSDYLKKTTVKRHFDTSHQSDFESSFRAELQNTKAGKLIVVVYGYAQEGGSYSNSVCREFFRTTSSSVLFKAIPTDTQTHAHTVQSPTQKAYASSLLVQEPPHMIAVKKNNDKNFEIYDINANKPIDKPDKVCVEVLIEYLKSDIRAYYSLPLPLKMNSYVDKE